MIQSFCVVTKLILTSQKTTLWKELVKKTIAFAYSKASIQPVCVTKQERRSIPYEYNKIHCSFTLHYGANS